VCIGTLGQCDCQLWQWCCTIACVANASLLASHFTLLCVVRHLRQSLPCVCVCVCCQVLYDGDGELKVLLAWSANTVLVCFRGSTRAANWVADAMVRGNARVCLAAASAIQRLLGVQCARDAMLHALTSAVAAAACSLCCWCRHATSLPTTCPSYPNLAARKHPREEWYVSRSVYLSVMLPVAALLGACSCGAPRTPACSCSTSRPHTLAQPRSTAGSSGEGAAAPATRALGTGCALHLHCSIVGGGDAPAASGCLS
jgi:hypothetical protein